MPSNINDPLIPGSKYTEYLYGTPKQEVNPKILDLNDLDLSLEDFQKMSSGKYNAGELKLTSSGKLDIVNNHKTWTMFNNTKIDAAESFAIRAAFADALEAEGISEKRMHSIRKHLGLGDDNSLRSTRAFTPLTRQEIREIIDKNIKAINNGREEGDKLKTYADMHAQYSKEELNSIKTERDAINRMADDRGYLLESDLLIAVHLTSAGDFSRLSKADAADYLEFIEDMRGSLEVLEDDEYRFAWDHENPGRDYNESVANKLDLSIEKGKVVVESKAGGKKVRIIAGTDSGRAPQQSRHV